MTGSKFDLYIKMVEEEYQADPARLDSVIKLAWLDANQGWYNMYLANDIIKCKKAGWHGPKLFIIFKLCM